MKTRTRTLAVALFSITLGACDSQPEGPVWRDEDPISRINEFYIDGQLADFEEQDEEFKEEINAALLESNNEDSEIKHRAYSCIVDCGGTNMTCGGTAGCAAMFDKCTGCDYTDDGDDGLDCWTHSCSPSSSVADLEPVRSSPKRQ